ncbi:MAG: YjgP/YjgQ family permease [Sediminibacterium sp.]|nr:YjgP/YjgQ family permease [Sediminibacterium sp.]
MIKKLDILIIKAFVGPFIAAFSISVFVLTMQFFWLYIDDLVGKGLDLFTIIKLVGLVTLFWIPTALPLSLLFSSIMTFGNLGESFELIAIKSSGIPLLRFMRPLLIFSIFVSGLAFLFANNIIPVTQKKLSALKYDIIVAKPAFDIKEGIFYDKIDGYVIKLGKKEKNDSVIHDVVIFEKGGQLQDYVTVAKTGVMRLSKDKRDLEFILQDGYRYEESGPRNNINTQFIQMGFKTYKKVFDLKSFQMSKTGDSAFYDPKMLSIRQLNNTIDSLQNLDSLFISKTRKEFAPYLPFVRFADTGWTKSNIKTAETSQKIDQLIPDSIKQSIYGNAINQISNIRGNAVVLESEYKERYQSLNFHKIEWHRKFALSAACLILFMIGAPLGSIIRKGGLGLPLVFAIIFFVIFYLLNNFGEKLVRSNELNPFNGMWLSSFLLIPIGLFLTYKAMSDSQLFNNEFYYRHFKQLRVFLANFTKRKQPV